MGLRIKVEPSNFERYAVYCEALRRGLEDPAPPFMVADMCRLVLIEALNGKWRLLRWLVQGMIHKQFDRWKEDLWWAWHLYIRQRTMSEIEELARRQLEEVTGENSSEWPEVVCEEEETGQR